jgi:glycosyltransferase involved in cell wall biosynthesis
MRIAFTVLGNSRRSNFLNGDTIRTGGAGASGTDTSTILIAEHLASKGHDVVITVDPLEPPLLAKYESMGRVFVPGQKVRGVAYTNFNFDGIENRNFDILVNSLWFSAYSQLPITVTKGLIYWCHMQWIYGSGEIVKFVNEKNLKLAFVNISEWERKNNLGVMNSIFEGVGGKGFKTMIPNPILTDEIENILSQQIPKKKHKVVFHASWARGGNVAIQTVRDLKWDNPEFHAFDYLMTIHDHKDPYFVMHMGVDKQTLFKHIAEAEYFIYPLYTPYNDVHKDTFSCVVAEALALKTNVVTYPIAALPEYYEKYCHWCEFPEGTDINDIQNTPLTKDGRFNTSEPLVKKIVELEKDTVLRDSKSNEASRYVIDSFNVPKIGGMWENLLQQFE